MSSVDRILDQRSETAYRDTEGYDWDQGINSTALSWMQAGYRAGYADAVRELADTLVAVKATIPFTVEVLLERLNQLSPPHQHLWTTITSTPAGDDIEPYTGCRRCRARKD